MAATWELDDLIAMQRMCYEQLAALLGQVPDDQMEARAGGDGYSVSGQILHACEADVHYLNVVDGGTRETPRSEPEKEALLEILRRTEAEMIATLDGMSPEDLRAKRTLPWREDQVSCLFILIHTIRHKHYHAGQLQSILYILRAGR
ncbi:MAG: DinB family protein [Armatimonadota bacterium]